MSELQDGQQINLAVENGKQGADRLKKRLVQSRGPSTQDSSRAWVDWESMTDVLGQPFSSTNIPLSKLDEMRRDPMLAFGLATKIIPLIRAKWYIKSTDARRAAFVDNCLRLIYARYVLGRNNCLAFGYSPGVKRFEQFNPDWIYVDPSDPEHNEKPVWPEKSVDAIIWKSFVWLNPADVEPHWNYKGEFTGIDFRSSSFSGKSSFFWNSGTDFDFNRAGSPNRAADIPLDWAIWATNEKDSKWGSIYGYPLLGHAFRYWWSYWHKFFLADRAYEKWADPPVIVYHPPENGVDGEGNVINFPNVALGVAEQARSGANIAIPSQVITDVDLRTTSVREWDIKQMESAIEFGALLDMFNYLDVMKLRSVMVPEMGLIESQQGQSSRNVAAVFTDQIQKSQAVLMEEIDFEINRFLIPQLLEANFGPGGPSCTKITTGFDPQDVETMRAIIGAIANKHGDVPHADQRAMLEYLGVPVLTYDAVKNKLEELAAEQEREAENQIRVAKETAALRQPFGGAPAGRPTIKASDTAGVDEDGNYYQPREVITLREDEEEKGFWKRVVSLFSEDDKKRDEEAKKRDELYDRVVEIAQREPNINLEVVVPEQPAPTIEIVEDRKEPVINLEVAVPEQPQPVIEIVEQPSKRMRKKVNRNEAGDIVSVDEIELDESEPEAQEQRFKRIRKLFNRDTEGNITSIDEFEVDDAN